MNIKQGQQMGSFVVLDELEPKVYVSKYTKRVQKVRLFQVMCIFCTTHSESFITNLRSSKGVGCRKCAPSRRSQVMERVHDHKKAWERVK